MGGRRCFKQLRPDLPLRLSCRGGKVCMVWEDTELAQVQAGLRFGIVPKDMAQDRSNWGKWGQVQYTLEDIHHFPLVSIARMP